MYDMNAERGYEGEDRDLQGRIGRQRRGGEKED